MESLTPDYIQGHDVPESIYRASPEWAASDLKYGITNGLEALYQRKFGKNNPPKTTTPAMKFGSMVHKFILEHSDFNKCYGLLDDKRSKVGKAKALVMQEKGIETYTSAELDTLIGIEQSLYKNDMLPTEAIPCTAEIGKKIYVVKNKTEEVPTITCEKQEEASNEEQ